MGGIMKSKKETRGGKRPLSGRKKADYETKTIAFRVRVEFVEPIKKNGQGLCFGTSAR